MPHPKRVFKEPQSIMVPPLDLGNGLSCYGDGLYWNKEPRMPLDRLQEHLSSQIKDEYASHMKSRNFLRAQCYFLGEANTNDRMKISELRKILSDRLAGGRTISPALLALEAAGNIQYKNLILQIESIIADAHFIPPTSPPQRSADQSPPKKKTKRDRTAISAISRTTQSADDMEMDDVGTGDVDLMQESEPPVAHARGGGSGALDTEKDRPKRAGAKAESFLLQLAIDPAKFERAVSISSATISISTPTFGNFVPSADLSDDQLKVQGEHLLRNCFSGMLSTDHLGYFVMIAYIQLAMWMLQIKSFRPDFTYVEAHELLGNPDVTDSQLRHWYANGYNLLRLIHATSVHILPAICLSTMRAVVYGVSEPEQTEIENSLRDPSLLKDPLSYIVDIGIIQYVRCMRMRIPDGVRIGSHVLGVDPAKDDALLAGLIKSGRTEHPFVPRGPQWSGPYDTFYDCSPPLSQAPTRIITTNFDSSLEQNRHYPKELRGRNKKNYGWTLRERIRARDAKCPGTLAEFENIICTQLEGGVKTPNSYVQLSSDLALNENILIHGKGGVEDGLICLLLSADTLSDSLKTHALQITRVTLGQPKLIVDSALAGEKFEFRGFHFGAWGKYSRTGTGAPEDDQETRKFLAASGQPGPYFDASSRKIRGGFNSEYFLHCPEEHFNRLLENILRPAISKLKAHIPGLMLKHETLHRSLSPTMRLGSAPFCMAVVNVQPATRAHRDRSDEVDSICLILALGDFQGGDLCLYEAGIRIALRPGCFLAIRSKRDIHFNLDYQGDRYSYVFTSDAGLRRWQERRNNFKSLKDPLAEDSMEEYSPVEPESEDEM